MSRDFSIPGESLVLVKGRSDSAIPSLTQLGLTVDQINVRPDVFYKDMNVDAWGMAPADVQVMMGAVTISINFVHVDTPILQECWRLSMGGPAVVGRTARAGARLGNNLPRFAPVGTLDANNVAQPGNNYIGLNISAPVSNLPWRFWYAYMFGAPLVWPLGTEKSIIQTVWRAIPYTQDPYGGTNSFNTAQPFTVFGTGGQNAIIWDRVLDT